MVSSRAREDLKTINQKTAKPPFAFLPFELYQAIIDNLSDDQAALCACSLTCKVFLHASRRHLFHSVHLKNRPDVLRFLDKICFTESPTNPCTYVRELSVHEYRVVNNTLSLLATSLPNVTSLNLYRFYWGKRLSGFQKVQRLLLQGSFQTSQQANEFISSFPSLTTLEIRVVGWGTYREPVIPLPCGLKSIAVEANQSHFFNRLLHLESHPSISSLCFRDVYPKDAQQVGELLKTLGSRLEHLRLTERHEHLATAVCANLINLAHNTHLRSVSLFSSTVRVDFSTLDWVCALFSQITSDHVEDVWFRLPVHAVDKSEAFFPSIERVFIQQHWSNLRQFRFNYSTLKNLKPIEAYMPILHSRGVVLVANG